MKPFRLSIILKVIGIVLIIEALFMLSSLGWTWFYDENPFPIIVSSLITASVGALLFLPFRKTKKSIEKHEAYLVVAIIWVIMSAFGALPYIFSDSIPRIIDAYFETVSGFTTTGSSILTNIEILPKNILYWRALTHWIGGVGIIIFTVALLPIFGFGGTNLFEAEATGPSTDKIHPRITETAKRLWGVYIIITIVQIGLFMLGDMNFYESVCHSFATVATGGFSPKNTSLINYSPYIQYVASLFMIIAGTNLVLIYWLLKGKTKPFLKSEEFKFYLAIVGFSTIFISIYLIRDGNTIEYAFRHSLFQAASIISSTGFVSTDYMLWAPPAWTLLFLLMFSGAMVGSTTGGIKIMRHLLLVKNTITVIKRKLHPTAIINVRLDKKVISQNIIDNVLAIFVICVFTFAISTLLLTTQNLNITESMSAVAATLNCIGPGVYSIGAVGNFNHVGDFGKAILCFTMIVGRLEYLTIYILFTRTFWKQ